MPILPKHRVMVPDGPLDEPVDASGACGHRLGLRAPPLRLAPATNREPRWIPGPGERMLVDDLRAIRRLIVAVRFHNQGASIELEDVDLERL